LLDLRERAFVFLGVLIGPLFTNGLSFHF
jgi:hypothetical protein